MHSESILQSVKKLIGIDPSVDAFDVDLVMHINSVLNILNQMGVGTYGFVVTGPAETWDQFVPSYSLMEMVRSYVVLKVRLIFDTPQSSSVMEAINRQIAELEWRMFVNSDPGIGCDNGGECCDE